MAADDGETVGGRIVAPGGGRAVGVPSAGGQVTMKVEGGKSGGTVTVFENVLRPHAPGPARHYHRAWTELFYVLEGEMIFQVDDQTRAAPAGTFVFVPLVCPAKDGPTGPFLEMGPRTDANALHPSYAVREARRSGEMLRMHHHRAGVRCFTSDSSQYGSLSQHYAGIHAIPVDRIVGSVGRSHELRSDFMPVGTRWGCPLEDGRYQSIRAAMRQGLSLPAIEVYKLSDCYYVLDGHHRVAAARATGQTSLDAIVTEFQPMFAGTGLAAAA